MLALELQRVSARYARAQADPLREVDFAIARGELACVLGPNGAGKTTLLRVLAGTLAPSEGRALLFGEPLASFDRRAVARKIAVVSQDEPVPTGFSVRDVVAMGRAPYQGAWLRESAEDARIVERAIERCDLASLASRVVDELSGGERRRVSIARALAQEAPVLLLDEPAAALDVRHQIDFYELLSHEIAESDLACVVVMHDLNAAAQYATRVVLMKAGRVVADGSVAEVMTYARLKEAFDADLFVGVNDIDGDRFFLPRRRR